MANPTDAAIAHPFLFHIPYPPRKGTEPKIKFEALIVASSIRFSLPSLSHLQKQRLHMKLESILFHRLCLSWLK